MKTVPVWFLFIALCLITSAICGGLPFWPNDFNNLRNPLLIAGGITLLFSASREFRSFAGRTFFDWENGVSAKSGDRCIFAIFVFYLFVFTKVSLMRYSALAVNAHDFSFYDYMIPNTLWGRFMQNPGCHYCNHFSYHPTWILFLMLPFQALTSSPLVSLLLCPILLWSAAWPLYRMTQELRFPIFAQVAVVLVYFNLYSVQRALMYDFHVEDFAPLLFFLFALALLKRQKIFIVIFAFLFMSIKEDMPLYLGGFLVGLIFFNSGKTKLAGPWQQSQKFLKSLLIFAIIFFALDLGVVKYLNRGSEYQALAPISEYGSKPTEILLGILSHPVHSLAQIIRGGWIPLALVFLFLPLFFLPSLLATLIHVVIHACSGMSRMAGLSLYYGAPLVPFVVVGFLAILFRATQLGWKNQIEPRSKINGRKLTAFVLGLALMQSLFFGSGYLEFFKPVKDYASLAELIDQMDGTKQICAQSSLLPHFPHLKFIFILDEQCKDPDYIISTDEASAFPLTELEKNELIGRLISKANYKVQQADHFTLYTRSP